MKHVEQKNVDVPIAIHSKQIWAGKSKLLLKTIPLESRWPYLSQLYHWKNNPNKILFRHLKTCKESIEEQEHGFSNKCFLRKFKLRLSRPSSGFANTTVKNYMNYIRRILKYEMKKDPNFKASSWVRVKHLDWDVDFSRTLKSHKTISLTFCHFTLDFSNLHLFGTWGYIDHFMQSSNYLCTEKEQTCRSFKNFCCFCNSIRFDNH